MTSGLPKNGCCDSNWSKIYWRMPMLLYCLRGLEDEEIEEKELSYLAWRNWANRCNRTKIDCRSTSYWTHCSWFNQNPGRPKFPAWWLRVGDAGRPQIEVLRRSVDLDVPPQRVVGENAGVVGCGCRSGQSQYWARGKRRSSRGRRFKTTNCDVAHWVTLNEHPTFDYVNRGWWSVYVQTTILLYCYDRYDRCIRLLWTILIINLKEARWPHPTRWRRLIAFSTA